MPTLLACLICFALGLLYRRVLACLETLAEWLASPLPDTYTLPISFGEAFTPRLYDSWVIAGEYLIHDNGVTRNTYLTRYARWLMGPNADVTLLTPAITREAYQASTPSGGSYTRVRTVRSHRVELNMSHTVRYFQPSHVAQWSMAVGAN